MAQLPPKIPSMSQNWPSSFPHQRHHQQHSSMANFLPSSAAAANPPSPPQPPGNSNNQAASCWMDEFLDFSSARRGAHRRSASDSIAFMESPLHAFDVEDCGHAGRNTTVHGGANMGGGGAFDRLDDEQLMSMFSDDISVPPTVTSSSNPSTPSDQNSNNDDNNNNSNSNNVNNNKNNHNNVNNKPTLMPLTIDGYQHQPKSEPGEVESSCDPHDPHSQSHGPPPTSPADPKRVKRILANRQSAQRSRVRKLQYISELERSVTSLQSEVSALSPRVAFLDHQRLILGVDNSALKQRIAALAQDKLFKDAHQEALKKEIERLRQVYHQKMGNANNNHNNNNQNVASHQQQQDHHHNPADVMLFTDHKEQQQILS